MRPYWRLLLPVLAFLMLGTTWAFASPIGSSADENFHLSSIWCAWGDSETCILDEAAGTAMVPTKVATKPCFVNRSDLGGQCSWLLLSPELVNTAELNPPSGGYPPAFYMTMRAFIGPDIDRSVLIMRMVNVIIAGAILLWALMLAPPVIGRAAAMAWLVAIIPTGVFFIASVNPSSWSIVGGSLYWVFLLTLIKEANWRQRRAIVALLGALTTAGMSVLSRSDSVWIIFLSTVAVLILEWPRVRQQLRHLWIVLAVSVPLAAIALYFRVGRYLTELSLSIPPGNAVTDQPNPLVKMLLELPAFLAGFFGLQQPIWVQQEDSTNWGLEGWVMNAFSFGVGALDVTNPSIAGVLAFMAVSGTLLLGLGRYSLRKLLAIAVVAVGLVGQMVFMRALGDFGDWQSTQGVAWVLQPRYFLPSVMVIVALTMICYPAKRPIFTKLQAAAVALAMSVAATTALMSVVARYMHGQKRSWVQFDTSDGWWWTWGPDPVLLLVIGGLAGLVYFGAMASLGVSYPALRSRAKAPSESNDSVAG